MQDTHKPTPDSKILLQFEVATDFVTRFRSDVSHTNSPVGPASMFSSPHSLTCTDCCYENLSGFYLLINVVSDTAMKFYVEMDCTNGPRRGLEYSVDWKGVHDMPLADVKFFQFINFANANLYA